jgi:hypothetical protein
MLHGGATRIMDLELKTECCGESSPVYREEYHG